MLLLEKMQRMNQELLASQGRALRQDQLEASREERKQALAARLDRAERKLRLAKNVRGPWAHMDSDSTESEGQDV
jgi:hypothetical protein